MEAKTKYADKIQSMVFLSPSEKERLLAIAVKVGAINPKTGKPSLSALLRYFLAQWQD